MTDLIHKKPCRWHYNRKTKVLSADYLDCKLSVFYSQQFDTWRALVDMVSPVHSDGTNKFPDEKTAKLAAENTARGNAIKKIADYEKIIASLKE